MRRLLVAATAALFAVTAGACGGSSATNLFVSDILSDPSLDGEITLDNGVLRAPVVATTFGNVQAGFDPGNPPAVPEKETRAFLVFDLAGIPSTASIGFASVTLFVTRVDPLVIPAPTVFPFFLDLMDTRPGAVPPPLASSDFNAPFLIDRSFNFLSSDAGNFVEIEVTTLMREAQATAQPFFEIRLTPSPTETGVLTIDDGPAARAPLLHVEFF